MIAQSWLSRCWQWQIQGFVAIVGILCVGISDRVNAQIVPDNTLGAERSVVTPNVNIRGIPSAQIDGGATRGANLFHSFSQFNVGAGRGAYFTNPAGILNIFSRVTGANRSDILGRLGVLGPANLFLINPQGIVFGPAASLDVQGSFLATTADGVKLGDTGLFSASQPATSNLLSVNPSALWFNTIAPQPIVNQSQAPSLIGQLNSNNGLPGLQVPNGQTLALVGGDVLLEGGNLTAAAGGIELGSVAGVGQVSLTQTGNRLVLGYDSIDAFGTISLSNEAFVDASGKGGGDIQIRGARLEMTQGSNIWANTLGAANGGNLTVTATDRIELSGLDPQGNSSRITAQVNPGATGKGGNLTVETGQLSLNQGGEISVLTAGTGDAGQLNVNATAIELIGTNPIKGYPSGLFANVNPNATGNGGDVTIHTQSLRMIDGANLSASTFGKGNAGNLSITATDLIQITGSDPQGNSSIIGAQVTPGATGKGGNLTVETGQLSLNQGGEISVSTSGTGDAGQLNVNATAIELIGTNPINGSPSGLFASVNPNATGNGGDVTIHTQSLRMIDGANLSASTSGEGNAGNLWITATDRIQITGSDPQGDPSRITAQVTPGATGKGGNLTVETGQLSLNQGGQISVSTFGTGDAGQLNVNATAIELIGTNPIKGNPSGLFANVNPNATGKGGDVTIHTQGLRILDGANLAASTSGEGNAGNLSITATDRIQITGSDPQGNLSSIAARVNSGATGKGGNLTVETGQLSLNQGGQISVSTFGTGDAGQLNVNANAIELVGTNPINGKPSGLFANVNPNATGKGGDVTIHTQGLRILDGANLATSTFGQGDAGQLKVNANAIEVIGRTADGKFPSGLFAQSELGSTGDAGNLTIDTGRLLVRDGARVSSRSLGTGTAGNIDITARDTFQADNGKITTDSTQSRGGAVTVRAGKIRLFGDSDITTNVNSGAGGGGNIYLKAGSILAFDDSDILAFSLDGKGGNITLDTRVFFGENYRPAPKGTDPRRLDGNNRVDINATGAVEGVITRPDTTFIQNSLTELPSNQINTDQLLANSCIVRRNQPTRGSFTVTGTGGLPQRPGDAQMSNFPTVDIETPLRDGTPSTTNPNRPWQKGDPIVEPQGVYRLPNGKLVMSRECSRLRSQHLPRTPVQ